MKWVENMFDNSNIIHVHTPYFSCKYSPSNSISWKQIKKFDIKKIVQHFNYYAESRICYGYAYILIKSLPQGFFSYFTLSFQFHACSICCLRRKTPFLPFLNLFDFFLFKTLFIPFIVIPKWSSTFNLLPDSQHHAMNENVHKFFFKINAEHRIQYGNKHVTCFQAISIAFRQILT